MKPELAFPPLIIDVPRKVSADAIDLLVATSPTTDEVSADTEPKRLRLPTRQGGPVGLWLPSIAPAQAHSQRHSQPQALWPLTSQSASRRIERKRAAAGTMDFTCRRGLLHDIHLDATHRAGSEPAARTGIPLFCSNGLPWEGPALGLKGPPIVACQDGELRVQPDLPPSDDRRCLAHRPDGSLYETTFKAARKARAAASPL